MTQRRHPPPSWLGTLVVAAAVLVMLWRASRELRQSITPSTPAPSSSSPR